MSKTNHLENLFLSHELGHTVWVRPVTHYFALFTAAPTDGGGGTECAGIGYVRKAMPNDGTLWSAPLAGASSNAVGIEFAAPTGPWGLVTHWGLFDAAAGGNLLRYGQLTTPRDIATGYIPFFPAGQLVISED